MPPICAWGRWPASISFSPVEAPGRFHVAAWILWLQPTMRIRIVISSHLPWRSVPGLRAPSGMVSAGRSDTCTCTTAGAVQVSNLPGVATREIASPRAAERNGASSLVLAVEARSVGAAPRKEASVEVVPLST